jgi:hypothetical protein
MTNKEDLVPTRDEAFSYVRRGVFGKGGVVQGLCGLRHKTVPFLVGIENSLTFVGVVSLLLRVCMFSAIALFPLILRKAIVAPPLAIMGPQLPPTLLEGATSLWAAVSSPAPIDIGLGVVALFLSGAPKLIEKLSSRKDYEQHPPYYDLASALRTMPGISGGHEDTAKRDEAIKLTLQALREEMVELMGADRKRRVTDVTLLEFNDAGGSQMQVRSRTAYYEDVLRPQLSGRFVAYYVAMLGRNFAEHDFLRRRNPFPKTRITVLGSPPVDYRSVLYMPVMCSKRIPIPEGQHGAPVMADYCVGVICVHSSKPYRFWRWGDHRRTGGSFADVAFDRSMPYIALLKRLLEVSAPHVRMEVT